MDIELNSFDGWRSGSILQPQALRSGSNLTSQTSRITIKVKIREEKKNKTELKR